MSNIYFLYLLHTYTYTHTHTHRDVYIYIYFTQQGSDAHDTMPFSSFGLLHPARPMSAQLENYMRLVNLRHMAHINYETT